MPFSNYKVIGGFATGDKERKEMLWYKIGLAEFSGIGIMPFVEFKTGQLIFFKLRLNVTFNYSSLNVKAVYLIIAINRQLVEKIIVYISQWLLGSDNDSFISFCRYRINACSKIISPGFF